MNETSAAGARRWVRRLFPIALIIVAFALLEGAARLAIWLRYGSPDWRIQETLEYAPFVLTSRRDFIYEYPPKRAGVTRMIVIGSSTAALIPPEIWKDVFIESDKSKIEVINFAQGSYMSTQELLLFTLYGIQTKPDYVITLDGINDITGLTKTGRPGIPYVNNDIERALNKPGLFFLERLFRRSQLINAVRKIGERRLEVAIQSDSLANSEMTELYRSNIEKVAAICRGIGAQHIAILQPYIHLRRNAPLSEKALSKNYLYRKEYMMTEMQKLRQEMKSCRLAPPATYLDATDVFDAFPEIRCFRDEAHLTSEGAKLLMKAIRGRIVPSPIAEHK
jgi:hypothetical protein